MEKSLALYLFNKRKSDQTTRDIHYKRFFDRWEWNKLLGNLGSNSHSRNPLSYIGETALDTDKKHENN